MRRARPIAVFLAAAFVVTASGVALAQGIPGHDQGMPDPIPPPLPKKPDPKRAGDYTPIVRDVDEPWGLPAELLVPLRRKARIYENYAQQFTCTERALIAEYDRNGEVDKEREKRYGYLLVKSPNGESMREYRQEMAEDGSVRKGEVKDEEPFPPAYAWVFLFSEFNEPYFSFRDVGERFDGFDWVREIEFRGSLAFTDGRDIRQWEGVVLVDAVTYTPLTIRAEPAGQVQRIEQMFEMWSKSFNILGNRTGPKPLGYRADIEFKLRREGLTLPTELRYDTFRAVGGGRVASVQASTREYSDYRITQVATSEEIGAPR